MSLLSQIQQLTETTYRQKTGVNFEKYLIGYSRFRYLSQFARGSEDLSELARVFFRVVGNQLYLGIYFDHHLIQVLEHHDPRRGLTEANITAFMIFIEEINHAVHGALKFLEGQKNIRDEDFIRDLEIQAKVDTYLLLKYYLAYFNASKQLEQMDRLWLRHHVFESQDLNYQDRMIAERYFEAVEIGQRFTRFLESLPPEERGEELSRFRQMDYTTKKK
ncbi:MAG: hypothetical protein D6814_06365, partial [Calditrichaeota bacterium]